LHKNKVGLIGLLETHVEGHDINNIATRYRSCS